MPTSQQDQTTCTTCGAAIFWAVTAKQKAMTVDAEPDTTGTGTIALYRDVAGRLRARVLSRERPTLEHSEVLHMTHWATCTNPPPRRRPGRRRAGVRPGTWRWSQ